MTFKRIRWVIAMLMVAISLPAVAWWHHEPMDEAPVVQHISTVYTPESPRRPMVAANVYTGSLKLNVVRIAKSFGWRVVWTLPFDYRFIGSVHVRANSVEGIFSKFLENYPVQAVFYQGNRVVVIKSRTL